MEINYRNLNNNENFIHNQNEKICRICLETQPLEQLFSPCLCSGNSGFIHRSCLDEWRSTSDNEEAFNKCMECNFVYHTKEQISKIGYLKKSITNLL